MIEELDKLYADIEGILFERLKGDNKIGFRLLLKSALELMHLRKQELIEYEELSIECLEELPSYNEIFYPDFCNNEHLVFFLLPDSSSKPENYYIFKLRCDSEHTLPSCNVSYQHGTVFDLIKNDTDVAPDFSDSRLGYDFSFSTKKYLQCEHGYDAEYEDEDCIEEDDDEQYEFLREYVAIGRDLIGSCIKERF